MKGVAQVWWLDEDCNNYKAWSMELSRRDIELRTFGDASSLVSALATERPALLVLDLMCVTGDGQTTGGVLADWGLRNETRVGLDLARELALRSQYAEVPVVILTNTSDETHEMSRRTPNVIDWVYKTELPTPVAFGDTIAHHLQHGSAFRRPDGRAEDVDRLFEGLIHDTYGPLNFVARGLEHAARRGKPADGQLGELAGICARVVQAVERYRWMYQPPDSRELTQPSIRVQDLSQFVRDVPRAAFRDLLGAGAERAGTLLVSPAGLSTLLAEGDRAFTPNTVLTLLWKPERLEIRFKGPLHVHPDPIAGPILMHLKQHFDISWNPILSDPRSPEAEIVAAIPWQP